MMRIVTVSLLTAVAAMVVAACSSPSVEQSIDPRSPAWNGVTAETRRAPPPIPQTARPAKPRIVAGYSGLQCVPYAREQSGISIRGNAWTWWGKAKGKYERADNPAVGSILVIGKTAKNKYGHLAVVTGIVNDREIIVNHANWLNKGQIHLDTPVRDVSARNDWSAVKFWYTPGKVLGKSTYPVSGFIYPKGKVASRN